MFAFNVYSQKCETKTDEFTGEVIKSSTDFFFRDKGIACTISFKNINESFTLKIKSSIFGVHDFIIPEKNKLFLKFKDGSILEIQSNKKSVPVPTQYGNGVVNTVYEFEFGLTKNQMNMFVEQNITAVKLTVKDEHTSKIDGKRSKKIVKSAKCIIE